MSDEHFAILKRGIGVWNHWREQNPNVTPDLHRADLQGWQLNGANLSGAYLAGARMTGSFMFQTRFDNANLDDSRLVQTDLCEACLSGATLRGANLREANLLRTNLSGSDLTDAQLINARLVETNLDGATLKGCWVYGISAWDVKLEGTKQNDLVVTPFHNDTVLTTDNLEVAQFIYLLLNNQKIRHVIDTITSKVVLILGRFTPERKALLDAIRDELRKRDYLPVLFDFEKPSSKTTLETVSTLAHMARFVVADITDAKSVLQELQAVVPTNPSVPIQPVILNSQTEPGMFDFFRMYSWVLEPYLYEDQDALLAAITEKVIGPAEKKVIQMRPPVR